jgi:hypothetical protein
MGATTAKARRLFFIANDGHCRWLVAGEASTANLRDGLRNAGTQPVCISTETAIRPKISPRLPLPRTMSRPCVDSAARVTQGGV